MEIGSLGKLIIVLSWRMFVIVLFPWRFTEAVSYEFE